MAPNQVDSKQDSKVGKVRVKCGSGVGAVLCKLSLKNSEKWPIFGGIESRKWPSPTFGANLLQIRSFTSEFAIGLGSSPLRRVKCITKYWMDT
jgi:hypothetical protein